MANSFRAESDLIGAALALGARSVRGWSSEEERLVTAATFPDSRHIDHLAHQIRTGHDPLGAALCELRPPEKRRTLGATYTPAAIVRSMLRWAKEQGIEPVRVIEPGAGSARFLIAAGHRFKNSELIGIEIDPLPAMIARANLATHGFRSRASLLLRDYRSVTLPSVQGATLYIGNPPYLRHHVIDADAKHWLASAASQLGYDASQLAGLHVYFFLATALRARPGDLGVFITAAEWLDVNYGRLVRQLFLNELGGQTLVVIEPTAQPFEDAATTAAIAGFLPGSCPKSIKVSRVADSKMLGDLSSGQQLHRARLEGAARWSHLTRRSRPLPEGHVELGELCRVHRGQVTGSNRVWIAGPHSSELPARLLFRTVTKARELFAARGVLADASGLRDVIDIPADLDSLDAGEQAAVRRFLRYAKGAGAASGYIARTRKAWWSVGLRAPAPILATYMARRPPAFVRNLAEVRHLNIAHGLYPRESFATVVLDRLAKYLSRAVSLRDGRTYAGGLTKFEPREMERLIVPSPEQLAQIDS